MTIQQMLLGAKSAGGGFASLDIQLTNISKGRTFGSATLNNNSSLTVYSSWGYSGYYAFLIPNNDTYRIEARGVNGTYSPVSSPRTPENYGARIIADVAVTAGNVLIFMAGQQSAYATSDGQGSGGGGMSGAAISSTTTNSQSSVNNATALVIAGGGGGSAYNGHYSYTTSTARGYANTNTIGRAGLHSGYSAEGHGWPIGHGGQASTASGYSVAGWNGGGYNSGGSGNSARSGGTHGEGFRYGAVGGYGDSSSSPSQYGEGGFGGGGGGSTNCGYGGGGGGYSGGGPGGYSGNCGGHGGGGGSYYTGTLYSASNYSTQYGYIRIRSSDLY